MSKLEFDANCTIFIIQDIFLSNNIDSKKFYLLLFTLFIY